MSVGARLLPREHAIAMRAGQHAGHQRPGHRREHHSKRTGRPVLQRLRGPERMREQPGQLLIRQPVPRPRFHGWRRSTGILGRRGIPQRGRRDGPFGRQVRLAMRGRRPHCLQDHCVESGRQLRMLGAGANDALPDS